VYLIKTLDSKYLDSALNEGSIHIGTINYYRQIEDEARQDTDEGLGQIVWTGQSLSGKDHNRIFSPVEKVRMNEDWTINNRGIPFHGSYPNFNAFTFCYSRVQRISDISKTAGGKANNYYFISDLPRFIKLITNGLMPIVEEYIREFEPEQASNIIRNLNAIDITYLINYSDAPKHRVVNEENLESFNPRSFHPQDFFQKNTSFSYEREVRTVWLFFYIDRNGKHQLLSLPHPNVMHVDLTLGKLPITTKKVKNGINIKVSTLKPEGA